MSYGLNSFYRGAFIGEYFFGGYLRGILGV